MPRMKKTTPNRTKQPTTTPSPKNSFFSQRKGSLPVAHSKNPPIPPLPKDNTSLDALTKNLSFSADFTSPKKSNSNNNDLSESNIDSNTLNNNSTLSKKEISSSKISLGSTLSLPPTSIDENVNTFVENMYKVPKSNDMVFVDKYNDLSIDVSEQLSTVQGIYIYFCYNYRPCLKCLFYRIHHADSIDIR